MTPVHSDSSALSLQATRQAMLVIHGIGEQNPYETLDNFARGVFSHFETRNCRPRLRPIEIAHKDWTQVGMHIDIFAPAPPTTVVDQSCEAKPVAQGAPKPPEGAPKAIGSIDIFEYYWAPLTEDKLSVADTLKWVLHTDLTPLQHFTDNLQQMIYGRGWHPVQATIQAAKLYLREMARILFLYVPLAAGLGSIFWWLGKGHSWRALFEPFKTDLWHLLSWQGCVASLCYLLFVLMAWFGMNALSELGKNPGRSVEAVSERTWFCLDVALMLVFLVGGLVLDLSSGSYVLSKLLRFVSMHSLWYPIAGAILSTFLAYALTAYVADVAVYTNMDAKSQNFAARNAILSGSTAALKQLLVSGYDRVILCGHSLGSVVAYDTINELLTQYNATAAANTDAPDAVLTLSQLHTLKALVTFGSPLDKIWYFFREHVKRDQAIRAQVLSMLHSFRKLRTGRTYGEFEFSYHFNQLDGLEWRNAWARMDPVSAELKFYRVDRQRRFPYRWPVLAHLSYWSDPHFYDYVCELL